MAKRQNGDIQASADFEGASAEPTHPCLSRRACLGGAFIVAGAGLTGAMPAAAKDKVTQKAASYQPTPKSKTNMCATCKYFIAPKSCVLVQGTISPAGWCQLFEKKSDKKS